VNGGLHAPEDEDLIYVHVTCLACTLMHLVNPKTRKVLGSDEEYVRGVLRVRARRAGARPEHQALLRVFGSRGPGVDSGNLARRGPHEVSA
jgi:hypothetical protein